MRSRTGSTRLLPAPVAAGAVVVTLVLAGCGAPEIAAVDRDDEDRVTQAGCGVERWSVKTGTDPDVGTIQRTPQDTTITALTSSPAPSSRPANGRIAPQERQVYRLRDVTLTEYKLESDSDYHLVVSDGKRTMIVEIPAPSCVGGSSPLAAIIAAARASFNAKHTPGPSFTMTSETVSVVGVGFFDAPHGQTGVGPNAFELHPVLGVCFGAGCDPGGGGGGPPPPPADMTSTPPDMGAPPSKDMSPPPPKDLGTDGGAKGCAHSPCQAGAKLVASCSACVAKVCASDKFCCASKWDAQCVKEAQAACGPSCGGGGGG